MSARLPIPGKDDGTWGSILNTFLEVAHNSDGTLVTTALENAGAITSINAKAPTAGALTLSTTDLADTSITTPADKQVLTFNSTSGKWTNQAPAATVDTVDTPPADSPGGSPGTNAAAAASANHSHPLSALYNAPMFGFPPNYAYDISFDGIFNGNSPGQWGYFANTANVASLSGSTYTLNFFIGTLNNSGNNLGPPFIMARNISVSSGITCKAGPNYGTGNGIVMVASNSITIDGTLDASGADATGATGAVQNGSWAGGVMGNFQGYSGANGGTGAGAGATNNGGSSLNMVGGLAGGGGAGASGAGGSAGGRANNGAAWFQWFSTPGIMYLMGHSGDPRYGFTPGPTGGGGGAAGGGDGTNTGGGGGGGGGCILLIAPKITIGATAVLNVSGGKGGNGTGGNTGGGGGGGGGLLAMHGLDISIASGATVLNAGGAGGAGAGTGTAGAPGSTGIFYDPPVAQGGFGLGAGCLICQWQ